MKLFILLALISCAQLPEQKKELLDPTVMKSGVILGSAGVENTESSKLHSLTELNVPNRSFDIPVIYNKEVEKWIKYFTGKGRQWFDKYAKNSVALSAQFSQILDKSDMPKDLIYLSMAESGFQNTVRSSANAVGAWQFMSFTGKRFGLIVDDFYDERRDPHKSAQAAAQYLKELYLMFGSWDLAMAAYNAGEGKISRAIKKYGTKDFWKLTKGRYLKPETKNYVPKIMALAIIGKNLEYYGFSPVEYGQVLEPWIPVVTPAQTDLITLCSLLGLSFDEFQQQNPEYTRWHTPLATDEYLIKIPQNKKEEFNKISLSELVATQFSEKVINKGSLAKVAVKEKIPVSILQALNPSAPSILNKSIIRLPFRQGHSPEDKMYADFKFVKRKARYSYRYVSSGVAKSGEYVVQQGDTLWGIAKKLGVSYNRVVKLNGKRKNLRVGELIALRD